MMWCSSKRAYGLPGLGATAGFTAAELMLVLAVMAIAAAIGAPAVRETVRNMHLKSDAQLLLANMQWAKGEAAKRNACVGVTFATVPFPATGGGYTVFLDDGSGGGVQCNRLQDGGESLLRTVGVNNDVSLVSAAIGAANSLCFTANAVSCGSQLGNVQLRNAGSWYRLNLRAAGGMWLDRSRDGVTWQ